MNKIKKFVTKIRKAAAEITDTYDKVYKLENELGLYATDENPFVFEITDDSGYRSIVAGDIRGNVSYNGSLPIEHKGYVILYSDNSTWQGNRRIWESGYRFFPPQAVLEKQLEALLKGEPVPGAVYYPGDDDSEENTRTFIAENIEKMINKIR